MQENLSGHQKAAADQPHDAHGRFLPKPSRSSVATVTMQQDSSLDAPLVSVSINNPFTKLLHWLDELRKKQTTEFDITAKLKIPLIAWIGVIAVIFSALNITQYVQNVQLTSLLGTVLNKYSTTKSVTVIVPTAAPTPVLISRIGTLHATYQLGGILSSTPSALSPTPFASQSHYVLLTSINQITFLQVPATLSLTPYLNKQVLVTGFYDAGKNTITIRQDTDIQYVP